MNEEELQKLDEEKRDYIYRADEVQKVLRVVEEMKDVGYVERLLSEKYIQLKDKIEEIHNKMFPK